jgi:hypothetical protein
MGLGRGAFSGGGGGGTDTATVQGMIDASIAAEAGTPGFAFVGVNQGANATTALPLMFSSSGVNTWEPPASGFIEGLFVDMAGTVTAGTADFQMLVDAVPHTLAGEVLQISGASAAPENRAKAVRLDTPIWVSAGQKVGAQCVSVGLAPTTLDPVLGFVWRPSVATAAQLAAIGTSTWGFETRSAAPYTQAAIANRFYLWQFFDVLGRETSLRMQQSGATYSLILMVNDVDILTADDSGTVPGVQNWIQGDDLCPRVYITSGSGTATARLRMRVNAQYTQDVSVSGGTWTLATPVVGSIASAGSLTAAAAFSTQPDADHILIGDSISGFPHSKEISYGSAVYTPAESRAVGAKRIVNLASYGDTLANQKAVWDASRYKGDSLVRTVGILGWINDINAGSSAASINTAYRAWTAEIKASNPSVKIIGYQTFPADTFAGMSAADQQVWIDLQALLAGDPNVDRWDTATSNTLNAHGSIGTIGQNVLNAAHDVGDGGHTTNVAKLIHAANHSAHLTALGLR